MLQKAALSEVQSIKHGLAETDAGSRAAPGAFKARSTAEGTVPSHQSCSGQRSTASGAMGSHLAHLHSLASCRGLPFSNQHQLGREGRWSWMSFSWPCPGSVTWEATASLRPEEKHLSSGSGDDDTGALGSQGKHWKEAAPKPPLHIHASS